MAIIKLEMLSLETEIPKGYKFYDDGFVDNVFYHYSKILFKYSKGSALLNPEFYEFLFLKYQGISLEGMSLLSEDPKACHIFYKKSKSYDADLKDIFIRGHEETHVLSFFKKDKELSDLIKRDLNLDIDLSTISDSETIADIGGSYALLNQGHRLHHIEIILDKSMHDVKKIFYRSGYK